MKFALIFHELLEINGWLKMFGKWESYWTVIQGLLLTTEDISYKHLEWDCTLGLHQ